MHTSLESTAVDFELRFTTALPSTDTTTLTRKLIALSTKSWKSIADLRQFDLCLAFEAVRVLSENVEDDRCAINRRTTQQLFEVALLCRRKLIVEHHGVGIDRHT